MEAAIKMTNMFKSFGSKKVINDVSPTSIPTFKTVKCGIIKLYKM